ncbi:MAG: inorganic diphosphatase [Bacilli bacterium]|nr:inorganic diphosphatase [Bacilli bacterium]
MHAWHDVKPLRIQPDNFISLIEISKGSKNKYELDKETGHLILDRVLFTSTHYPQNYGFIPRTYARDYDPLDVLVLCSETILPMSFVRCAPIGVLIMSDNGLPDEKIIAVCVDDPFYKDFKDISDIPDHVMVEIRHFFTVYKSLEDKSTDVDEILGREKAIEVIKESIASYKRNIEPKIIAERKARGY